MWVRKLGFLALSLCLLATAASAQITSISPSSFSLFSSEEFMTIRGENLAGTTSTQVVFDSQYTVEPNNVSPTEIIVFVAQPSLMTVGTHTVEVLAIDGDATRTLGPVNFTVVDLNGGPPSISYPEVVVGEASSTEGGVVEFEVFATDNAGPVPVSCTPESGSLFSLGGTDVSCTATNSFGTTTVSFIVFVGDTVPPVLTVPDNFTTEGPVVRWSASAVDNLDGAVDVNCSPASGSTFLSGVTSVRCSAVDAHLNYSFDTFEVTVTGGAPMLILPEEMFVHATSTAGAIVDYTVGATGDATVSCSPASGTQFPLATTQVTCTATNAFGSTTGSFLVAVVDWIRPVLTIPSDITVVATSPDGAVVTFTATAVDGVDGPVPVTCTPPSGSQFPLGTTEVQCIARDAHNNPADAIFRVNVIETPPPVLILPDTITAEATSAAGAVVTYTATAEGGELVTCTPPSGSTFPLGTTTVQCSATNAAGTTTGSFDVIVVDTTAPVIVSVTANPNVLWPPNHQMVNVAVAVNAVDVVDPSPTAHIISVSSNQPVNGTGDGDTAPDWNITGPLTVQLRSERSHGVTRVYTITVEAADDSGNTVTSTVQVVVTNKPNGKLK